MTYLTPEQAQKVYLILGIPKGQSFVYDATIFNDEIYEQVLKAEDEIKNGKFKTLEQANSILEATIVNYTKET